MFPFVYGFHWSAGYLIFLGIFYLVGFGILGFSLWSAWQSTQAASWLTTPGTVADISLKESSDSEGTSYHVDVRYAYVVDGVDYEGTRVAFGYAGSSGREAMVLWEIAEVLLSSSKKWACLN